MEAKLRDAQTGTFGKMPDYPIMDFSTFKHKRQEGTLFSEFNHH